MKENQKLNDHLYNGQTIAISGVDSSFYPKSLIKVIKESGVSDLTLIYIENNSDLDKAGDPMELIYNGQVTKLITSHLGEMSKTFSKFLDDIELLPMDVLAFKMQAGANKLPGITIAYDYAKLYRDAEWLDRHSFFIPGKGKFVMEEALNADISLICADNIDPDTMHCSFEGTNFNSIDVARCGTSCFAEYNKLKTITFDEVDLPGQYISGIIASEKSFSKTNWQ